MEDTDATFYGIDNNSPTYNRVSGLKNNISTELANRDHEGRNLSLNLCKHGKQTTLSPKVEGSNRIPFSFRGNPNSTPKTPTKQDDASLMSTSNKSSTI